MSSSPVNGECVNPVRPMCTLDGEEGPEGVERVGEEDEEEDEKERETRPMRSRVPPKGPSEEERRQHRVTHYPFRSWCPVCVAGRAKNYPHRRREPGDQGEFPEISFDYCFPRKENGGEYITVLVGRERRSKMIIAHVVPMKGAGLQWMVDQVVRDIRKLGIHGRVILKGDQENSLVDLLGSVCKARGENGMGDMMTVLELSPKGESQSNGLAERAVQEIEEGLRTHLLDLEKKLGAEVNIDHPVISWMVENIADIVNKQCVGADGKNPTKE